MNSTTSESANKEIRIVPIDALTIYIEHMDALHAPEKMVIIEW